MTTLVVAGCVLLLLAINVALWKFGFVHDAEKPETIIDRPVLDSKERRAFLKRLRRWKEQGRLTREEFEHVTELIQSEWDEVEDDELTQA